MEEKIKFDFCIEGVTSISADLHKYGYCPKGVFLACILETSSRKLLLTVRNAFL